MTPDKIRLIHLESRSVRQHAVGDVLWDKVWAISHIWDRGEETTIPLEGILWKSSSFSSETRFNLVFEKTRQIVEARGGEYVWLDAACIHQDDEGDKREQVPCMGDIYSKSAGTVAFGTLSSEDRFVPIVSTYDNGRNAWVCDWFERVWTFQELQLPKVLLFVSGNQVLTRNEIYLSLLLMAPYLTSYRQSPPSSSNDPHLSIQDVINTLSPLSRTNTQRALMQTSRRGCSTRHVHDKVYGILGVLSSEFSRLKVDYNISLQDAVRNLMALMPQNDVLDTLTFNTLPPVIDISGSVYWSGMMALDHPTEHPSYETDIYHPTHAVVVVEDELSRITTVVHNAPLWNVVVTKSGENSAELDDTRGRVWPAVNDLSRYAKLTDDFSKVEPSADYASAVGRAERSLAANWTLLRPLLEKTEISLNFLPNPPSRSGSRGIPPNRLGDPSLFDHEVTVLVCRSKADKSFHYGIVVTPNGDGSNTWHKVCTAAFSDNCVMATSKGRIESLIVIGK